MTNEEVYEQCAEPIHRFFANKVATASRIDDLMHTTFLRFFEKRREETILEPLRFLYGIARNVLLEYWRAQKRSDLHDEVGELSIASLGAGISTLLTRGERQRIVLDSLREIRLDYQTVLELQYWEQLSYNEIAELLGEKPRTIGTWLRRGRAQLRRIIKQKLAEEDGNASAEASAPEAEPQDDSESADSESVDGADANPADSMAHLMAEARDATS